MQIWNRTVRKITTIPMKSNKPLYEFLYTKHDHFGFTMEQDLKILKEMYPDAKRIKVLYSVVGEAYFVLEH